MNLVVLSENIAVRLKPIATAALVSAAITFIGTSILLRLRNDFTADPLYADFQARLARASAQRESLDALRERGYHFTYDFLNTPSSEAAPAVKRLIDSYGPDFVGQPLFASTLGDVGDVEKLLAFPSLQNIDFTDSDISDPDLRTIACLPNLKTLFLNHTDIGLEGIRHLLDSRIEILHLYGCDNIDESCIPDLSRLKTLRKLDIDEQNFSEDALRELSSALPNCKF